MLDIVFIRNILKEYIDKKVGRFIIYPFGINGVNTKNVLKDYFDLEPCYIVDNECSKYNSKIINKDELKNVYQKDMYIILTIENAEMNKHMLNEISEFISDKNIINLYAINFVNQKKNDEKIDKNNKHNGKGFRLIDFLPSYKLVVENRKIKVRIAHTNFMYWNVISTIYQEFKKDDLFDVLLIITNRRESRMKQTIEQVQKLKYSYAVWNEYEIQNDKPDIIILQGSYDSQSIGLNNYVRTDKVVVQIFPFLMRYTMETTIEYWERLQKEYGTCSPDYYLYDSLLYKEISQLDCISEKIVEMGNAKFDVIYSAMQRKDYFDKWEKLKGKVIVLWATSHGIWEREINANITFDLYAKTIFEYAEKQQALGIIFRPHSGFVLEMQQSGFWSHDDVKYLKEYCDKSSNIVYDDADTYEDALAISDGILTDACCGISCTALPTLKPICAAYRSKEDELYHKEVLKNYYSAYEGKDIIDFFEMLKNRQDPMLELRKKASIEYIKNFDGKNGWRIKEFVKEKYFEIRGE